MSARVIYLSYLTDKQLLELIQADDRSAFDTIYLKFWDSLFNAAYKRIPERSSCEEIVQDLFVHFYQIRAQLDVEIALGPYLHGALKNRILNHLRNQNRRAKHMQMAALRIPLSENNTAETVSYNALQRAIGERLLAMPAKYRAVYQLNKQQHFTIKVSAEKLGISEHRAEKYLRRAMSLLKSSLGDFLSAVPVLFFLHGN